MAKTIRETLLGTLEHGQEIMENIRVMRAVSGDKDPTGSVAKPSEAIHRKELKLVVQSVIDTGKQAKIFRFVSEDGYLPPFVADSTSTCSLRLMESAPAAPTACPPRHASGPTTRLRWQERGRGLCPTTCWIR